MTINLKKLNKMLIETWEADVIVTTVKFCCLVKLWPQLITALEPAEESLLMVLRPGKKTHATLWLIFWWHNNDFWVTNILIVTYSNDSPWSILLWRPFVAKFRDIFPCVFSHLITTSKDSHNMFRMREQSSHLYYYSAIYYHFEFIL